MQEKADGENEVQDMAALESGLILTATCWLYDMK